MKKFIVAIIALVVILTSCEEETEKVIIQGNYPVKEYYLERDPKVNVWGAGMDLIHSECMLSETDLDYAYLEERDDFSYDLKFFIVKTYYYDSNGDLQNEGCPAILLSPDTKACKIGEGITFFDEFTSITEDILDQLANDPVIDYSEFKDETTGFYDREKLFTVLDSCIIGQSFRSNKLEISEDITEQELQPVYLIETIEGGYAKFMVKQFKGLTPNEKQTLMRWQVMSE